MLKLSKNSLGSEKLSQLYQFGKFTLYMYLFSRVPNFSILAFWTNSRVLIFAYFQRGLSADSAEKRILKIGLLEPEINDFKVCRIIASAHESSQLRPHDCIFYTT